MSCISHYSSLPCLSIHHLMNHPQHFKFKYNILKNISNHSINLFFSHTFLFGCALIFLVYSLINIYFIFHFSTHYFMLNIKYCLIALKISHNLHKNISNQFVNTLYSHASLFHCALVFYISISFFT